jgi:hypothetical protein
MEGIEACVPKVRTFGPRLVPRQACSTRDIARMPEAGAEGKVNITRRDNAID